MPVAQHNVKMDIDSPERKRNLKKKKKNSISVIR